MNTATIAVNGSASGDFPPDYAVVHVNHQLTMPARSEALAEGNAVISRLRALAATADAGVREVKVRSLRASEMFNYVSPERPREPFGWSVQVISEIEVVPTHASTLVAALIKLGISVQYVTWHLDHASEVAAFRAVRRRAVAEAAVAAEDFADALGGALGVLLTLSDPGLLDGDFEVRGGQVPMGSARRMSASATSGEWNDDVDIDPDDITVSANVQARYEVVLA